MLSMPATTPYDLNFRLFGVPVRISPWFWLVSAMLGSQLGPQPELLLTWVACIFGSILIHEMGHALTGKYFGYRPRVALYWMGGLCQSNAEESPREKLAVLLMGPGAQFLLVALIFLVGKLVWGIGWGTNLQIVKGMIGFRSGPVLIDADISDIALFAYEQLCYINIIWALVNLLPIYPLDGGQITQVLLVGADRVHGARRTHIISLVTAGAVAAYAATRMGSGGDTGGLMRVMFFGSFALMNYQALQAHHDHFIANGPDDADWWKR